MDFSIVIVSWNTKELLKKCIESVVHNNIAAEVIVVDNGSTDGSVEMVEKFSIKLIKNKENLGFAKAVNQGIKKAEGQAILLLNSDTQVKPESLEKLLEFEKEVRPAIIGAKLLNPDKTVQASIFHLPTIKGAMSEYWFGKKNEFTKYDLSGSSDPVRVEAVIGGAMLISRAVIEKIGLLDERYFMYFEDLDYCRRAQKAGFKIYYLPAAEIIHEHGASGKDLARTSDQWRRLIPSSKIYHGLLQHYLISFILWTGQKLRKKQI